MKFNLSPRHQVVLDYISEYQKEHPKSPSIAQISVATGMSRVTVYQKIKELVALGVLKERVHWEIQES